MDQALRHIAERYNVDLDGRPPIELKISRWNDFPVLLADLGYRIGAEIGVEEGKYSQRICQGNPTGFLYSVDAWRAYSGYREHVSQKKLNGFYQTARERLAPYNCEILRAWSLEAAEALKAWGVVLDYVYIDGNHEFTQVANDIAAWAELVRPGGIVAGHDFKRSRGNYVCHVKDVVQAWTYSHGIRPWFVTRGDKAPSWFWVKE